MSTSNLELAINGGKPVSSEFIPIHKPVIEKDDIDAVTEAIKSTFVSGDGPSCREFENKLKDYLNVKHVFFVNSCTSALDLAFMIKAFPIGSEVIVPNFTYTSSALAPILNNLKPIFVDVSPKNGNIDVTKIEKSITDKTVAIIPVDYAGNPADMNPIKVIARKYGLYIVHDTAQSLGSVYRGKKTGTLADVSCFSFHGTKNITTGEGGALVTDDDTIAEKVKIARDKGTNKWSYISDPTKKGFYEYVSLGNSYVQSNILGALGTTQIGKIERITNRRREIAAFYDKELKDVVNIQLPKITENCQSNYHIYYLLVPEEYKSWIIEALRSEGIGCNVHYNPLHMNKYYHRPEFVKKFPMSVKFYNRLIRIPIYPTLTGPEIVKIASAVKKVLKALD